MRLSKAPLRISLGGGGTDLPAYAERFGGFCVVATIDKYVRVVEAPSTGDHYTLHYRETERATRVDDIRHPLFRECLRGRAPVEIASFADLPGESGLGSSSAFAVAMMRLNDPPRLGLVKYELAEMAARIERDRLGEPIGKQDHFASAYGGARFLHVYGERGREVVVGSAISLSKVRPSLLIFSSTKTRKASTVLAAQGEAIASGSALGYMHAIKGIGECSATSLQTGDSDGFGECLRAHWEVKRKMSLMTDPELDAQHGAAIRAGARGGKLMGAGGGGYWLFSVPLASQPAVEMAMKALGCEKLQWEFESEGCTLVEGL